MRDKVRERELERYSKREREEVRERVYKRLTSTVALAIVLSSSTGWNIQSSNLRIIFSCFEASLKKVIFSFFSI